MCGRTTDSEYALTTFTYSWRIGKCDCKEKQQKKEGASDTAPQRERLPVQKGGSVHQQSRNDIHGEVHGDGSPVCLPQKREHVGGAQLVGVENLRGGSRGDSREMS